MSANVIHIATRGFFERGLTASELSGATRPRCRADPLRLDAKRGFVRELTPGGGRCSERQAAVALSPLIQRYDYFTFVVPRPKVPHRFRYLTQCAEPIDHRFDFPSFEELAHIGQILVWFEHGDTYRLLGSHRNQRPDE